MGLERWHSNHEPLLHLQETNEQLTPIPNSSFRGSGTHFQLLQSPGTHTVYKQTRRQKIYTHKIKTNKYFKVYKDIDLSLSNL